MMRMAFAVIFLAGLLAAADSKPYLSDPCPSPDGSEIAFVAGGDIWAVPAKGGEAHLLVSHPATESRPMYSPDGQKLAFVSTRTGNGDVYVLTLANGGLKRLTFSDAPDQLDGWSRDGKWIYFSSTASDIAGMSDVFRVSAEGGTPLAVAGDRYATEYFSAPAPDGKTLAITARGMAGAQWWRKGHSHLDESEIWLVHEGMPPRYEQLTNGDAKEAWPMWSRDGHNLFYVSDRSGAQNIWNRAVAGNKPRQVTQFNSGRVVWPAISYDGRIITFERDFGIWKLDTETSKAAQVAIELRGAPAAAAAQHLNLNDRFQGLSLSPDGKKVAFTAHGEIFAASAKDGGDAQRVTRTGADNVQIEWAPDSRRLIYTSDRDGDWHIFEYDFGSGKETKLTNSGIDIYPRFSPDGKQIAFERAGRELHILDLDSKQDRAIANGYLEREPGRSSQSIAWSPDGKWLAYLSRSTRLFTNVNVVPSMGGQSHQVSYLSNGFSDDLLWSPDGTYLLFGSTQRTEPGQVARVDLIPRTPRFHEDEFRDLFKPTGQEKKPETGATPPKPPAKPVEVVFDDIRRRTSLLPTGLDVSTVSAISPDGKTLLLTASAAGQQNLYTYSLDELSREPAVARQLTSTPGFKNGAQFSPDGKQVFYLEQGKISTITLDNRQAKPIATTAEMDVDFAREKMEVFRQAWTTIRDTFFNPKFNGVDWNATRTEYEPFIAGSQTPDEERRLINLMLGELNASHSGISAGQNGNQSTTGRLGLGFDRAEYESSGHLKVTEVLPLGPGALAGIKAGDTVSAVDGTPVDARTNLDELLDHRIGKRVTLKLADREVVVRPVNMQTEKSLRYRAWVDERRAYVDKISGGKLGYVHMQDMSGNALTQLTLDLDTENQSRQGVVIDVRNNNGGFVNVYAIDILSRRGYLKMTPRDEPESPARSVLGQRSLEVPTILVTNQHSLSDAEDFTEGYRSLKLGKVVGEPTAGWIIYTGGSQMIDGSALRTPSIRITDANGQDMELHPRPVDIPVTRPVGESYTDHDSQLDAAVKELLSELKGR
ncbi:MAG TPA: S41 family peptidase [Bryobacteraceae bacterium]|nr:S41 family peptidase [Bryobacteraceae bacterium]